ncbi:MAG: GGDEF domain-containing protein [Gammaproteobacteria bacterium]|nr:GGDEF domain-containing protein [Gammaproteobacteria bacterium]
MKPVDGYKFVDSLAEVTSYLDKDIIERSLLQTLTEYADSKELRLYRVIENDANVGLALMAYSKGKVIDTLDNEIRNQTLPDRFNEKIQEAIDENIPTIVMPNESDKQYHIIFPASNRSKSVFAVLIQSNDKINYRNQQLIHAMLKVYSNYLELIDKSCRDKLTQLLNRETLDSEITRILIRNNSTESNILKYPDYSPEDKRKSLKNSTFWLGVVDIDHFKSINDNFGHLYGDDILILVARLMEKSIRDYDSCFRYGGEEFVIIMLANEQQTAKDGFERIRKEIFNHSYADLASLSVSIGYTQITNQLYPADVIEQADNALYYAKEHGRNQVQYYQELVDKNEIEANDDEKIEAGDIDFF